MTVTFTVTDEADNEDGRRLQRSTDGGSTWNTVDDVGPNVTTLEDPNPVLYEPVQYRTQVYTEHVVSNSSTVTVTAVRGETLYAELGPEAAPTVIEPGEWTRCSVSPEHTAIWGATLEVAPADRATLAYAFDELRIYYGQDQFFDGSIQQPSFADAGVELQGYGKIRQLRETTRIVTYPGALGVPSAPLHDCIADYWGRTAASATVQDAPGNTVRTGELFYDAPNPTDFSDVLNLAADLPVVVDPNYVETAQTCFVYEGENWGNSSTQTYANGDFTEADDFSGTLAEDIVPDLADVSQTFTLGHEIPSSRVGVKLRLAQHNHEGELQVFIDGQKVYANLNSASSDEATHWQDATGGTTYEFDQTGESVPDPPTLSPGDHTIIVKNIDVSPGGTPVPSSGICAIDLFAIYDTDYAPTFPNSTNSGNDFLPGPELYPQTVDATFNADEFWHTNQADLTTTWDDTSNGQALGLSVDGTNFATASNATSLSADFDARNEYGTTVDTRLTFSRYGSRTSATPTEGFEPQRISALELRLDTDDMTIVEDTNPVVLDADTDLENIQTLHEVGDYRFVTDHSVSGLVVESFRRGDSAVQKSADWMLEANGDSERRDTLDYANRINAVGDGVSLSIIHTGEVSRVGEEVPVGYSSDATTRADLVDEARRELITLVGNDERSGQLDIAPHLVLPGYPYAVPAFGSDVANLNGVTFEFGAGSGSGTLEFGVRRTLARQVSQNQR